MFDSIIFTDITDNISAAKPLGAYKCAQSLRENGYSCLVVDNFHCFTTNELLALIDLTVSDNTKLVGFSNTFLSNSAVEKNPDGSTPYYPPLVGSLFFPQGQDVENQIISALRQKNSRIKIVIGGAKANPNETSSNIDYVCIGYSEGSILNLMNHLANGEILQKSSKNIWGKIIIDDRKAEGYNFINSQMTWLPTDVINQQVLPLEVARGCIFKCKFCSYPMNGKQQLDFVRNDACLSYELERNYNEYGIYRYIISDDTFNDNDYKLNLILNAVKKLKFQPEFWAYTRLDLLSRNIDKNFQKLYDIGLRATQFGIETMNEHTGKIIGKGYSRKKQIEAVQYIRNKYGNKVSMHGTFITGLPHETEESCIDTFNLLQTQEFPLHSWRWGGLKIYKSNRFAWNSDISLNYRSYGYHETSINESSDIVNWKNEYTTYESACQLSSNFNQQSNIGNIMRVPNILGWSILTLGYNPEFITDTIYSQINFNEIENKKIQFMTEYKQKLFNLLATKNAH